LDPRNRRLSSSVTTSESLIAAARRLSAAVRKLKFAAPVTHVYNPLDYAWRAHEIYLRRYGNGPKSVIFLGMNPGPFGMAQTGIPFGQVAAVRDWLGITAKIDKPRKENPKRPVLGFDCHRSEISGERLWALFRERFETAENFFRDHIVMNYCPLAFVEESGRNRTPDKLPPREREKLFAVCDEHLREIIRVLQPEWLIGVSDFAANRAREVITSMWKGPQRPEAAGAARTRGAKTAPTLGQILHPSPACPASNNDWSGKVTAQLRDLGAWP
jgi:single-strand selective monofunctional uracil DNA glycosylase